MSCSEGKTREDVLGWRLTEPGSRPERFPKADAKELAPQ